MLGIKKHKRCVRCAQIPKVSQGEIPHYKIGHLIRFKKEDIDIWLEGLKKKFVDAKEKAKKITDGLKPKTLSEADIDIIIRKAIESENAHGYNQPHGEQASKEGR